jgi:hypothetical protein
MQYIIYSTQDDAVTRSYNEAVARGCTGDITSRWWQVISHPTNGTYALAIDVTTTLTASEKLQLVSQATMISNGWFPVDV